MAGSGNTFDEAGERLAWLSDADAIKEKAEAVYFVGCLDSYRYPEVAAKTFRILKRFGVSLLPKEGCCGSLLIRTGSPTGNVIKENLCQIREMGRVIFIPTPI